MFLKERDLASAQKKILKAAILINGRSLMELKLSVFNKVKDCIYDAALLMNGKVDATLTKEKPASPQTIIDFFDQNYPQWRKKSRFLNERVPRQILQYFLSVKSDLDLGYIAELTGMKDHSSIILSRNVVSNMIETNNQRYLLIYEHVIKNIFTHE